MLRLAVHFLVAIGVVISLGGFSEVTAFNGLLFVHLEYEHGLLNE